MLLLLPHPLKGVGHDGQATTQGLNQRSLRGKEKPKSRQRKESIAGQCRMK